MNYEVLYKGSYALAKISLNSGEKIKAESNAMVSMSDTIDLESKMEGGLLGGFKRALAGESVFFQTLAAERGQGEVYLAPSSPGDILALELNGSETLIVQKDGFLAATDGIVIDTKTQGLTKGLLSGEGFFLIKISGSGTVFLSSYGAIHELEVGAGKNLIVDNGHLVAWPETMNYSIEKAAKGLLSSFTSGEGLVCKFNGPGKVYIQSRNPDAFGSWLAKFIPTKS